jgi:hypothetical protein
VKRPLGRHSDKGRIILKWFLGELVCEGVDWINLAQDTVWWRVFVNTAMKDRKLPDCLSYYKFLEKDFVPWSYSGLKHVCQLLLRLYCMIYTYFTLGAFYLIFSLSREVQMFCCNTMHTAEMDSPLCDEGNLKLV